MEEIEVILGYLRLGLRHTNQEKWDHGNWRETLQPISGQRSVDVTFSYQLDSLGTETEQAPNIGPGINYYS